MAAEDDGLDEFLGKLEQQRWITQDEIDVVRSVLGRTGHYNGGVMRVLNDRLKAIIRKWEEQ